MIINCHFYLLQLKTLYHIGNLTQLRYLNISKCANVKDITELQSCSCLQSLNLSGLKLSPDAFSVLEGKENFLHGSVVFDNQLCTNSIDI